MRCIVPTDPKCKQRRLQLGNLKGPWPLTLGTTSQQLMGKINVPYAVTLSATGGSGAPYTFTLTGDLPAGLSFNAAAGTITGTPVVAGGQEVTLSVKDSAGMEVSTDLQVMVNSDLAVADIADVTCVQGGQGSIQVSASQGTAPYGLSWSPGLLVTSGLFDYTSAEGEPPAATAVVTCRPTTVGDATLDLYVEDATGTRVKKSVRLHVLPAVQLPTPTLTTVVAGTGTQLTLAASGGAGVYTWSVASGSLPAGMHLSADGVLSGTPTGHEVARFTLQVTDATGSTAQQSYTVETLSADAAAAADDPASPPPTFTREVRTRSVSLAQSGGVNETIEDRYTSDDGERDELIGQGFATTENDNPSFRYKLWKRNSVNDPAGWTYTSGSENLMSPEEVKSIIDAQGDGPALSKVMDGIDKAAFVAGQSSTDSVSAGTSRYKGFVVGSWTDVRMRSSKPVKEDTTFTFLLSTGSSSSASSSSASPDAPKTYRTVSVTIPKGRTQPLEGGDDSQGTIQLRPDMKVKTLLPIEVAPEVLRVNTDFDEGKIVDGYAVPDSKETNPSQPSLRAERNSLDGRFKAGELITDDLYQGFFGLRPGSMPADFFDGAEVLIAKEDKTDEDTGRPESGVVRLHATKGQGTSAQHWSIPVGGPESGAPQNLVPLLYSSSPQIPRDGVTFWIEGVTGGRITLEFYYKKGSTEFSHKQEFLVCTQQTKAQWRQEIVDQIKLQTSGAEDLSAFVPTNEFNSNVPHIKAVYGFYAQLFVEKPEKLMWAGMAKLAGAPVFAGLSDAQWGRDASLGVVDWIAGVKDFQSLLMTGNRIIFDDLGWQHRAFVASGLYALKHVNAKDPAVSGLPVNITAWDQIEEGCLPGRDPALIKDGSLELLRREQRFIIQPVYDLIKLINIPFTALGYDDALSVLAENPIPGGLPFADLVTGNLAVFADRWAWIDGGSEGMFQIWVGDSHKGLNAASRLSHVKTSLTNRAEGYANFPASVP